MFFVALILYAAFLLCYIVFAAALIYHVRKYAVSSDPLHTYITPFIILSVILILASVYFFLQVPWENLY